MEEILNWHWWMYAAIIMFILEIFTPGFIAACIGIGAASASLAAYIGINLDGQLISFALTSLLSLFVIRPLLYKNKNNNDKIKTNTDALIGRYAIVTQAIDNSKNKGRVSIDGDVWRAKAEFDQTIQTNEKVIVTSIESTIVTVNKI